MNNTPPGTAEALLPVTLSIISALVAALGSVLAVLARTAVARADERLDSERKRVDTMVTRLEERALDGGRRAGELDQRMRALELNDARGERVHDTLLRIEARQEELLAEQRHLADKLTRHGSRLDVLEGRRPGQTPSDPARPAVTVPRPRLPSRPGT